VCPLTDIKSAKPINHPANLKAVYQFAAELLGADLNDLARGVEVNFFRVFGAVDTFRSRRT
jgi:Tat protein secretion system quality control protein TatD with DNase activity